MLKDGEYFLLFLILLRSFNHYISGVSSYFKTILCNLEKNSIEGICQDSIKEIATSFDSFLEQLIPKASERIALFINCKLNINIENYSKQSLKHYLIIRKMLNSKFSKSLPLLKTLTVFQNGKLITKTLFFNFLKIKRF